MTDKLLCERDVLNMTGWPSRKFLDKRIKTDRFPRPAKRYVGVGDQWLESSVLEWMGVSPAEWKTGERRLLEMLENDMASQNAA